MENKRNPAAPTGLQLPVGVGIAESEQKKLHHEYDTFDKIDSDLAMMGFIAPPLPEFECPAITEEILTTPDSKAYTTTYAQQLAWFNYSSQILSRIRAQLVQVTNEMEMIASKTRIDIKARIKASDEKKLSLPDIQDIINTDARYSELNLEHQKLLQSRILMDTIVEGIERGLKVISRQVEIRKIEIEQEKVNIPNRGYGNMRGNRND